MAIENNQLQQNEQHIIVPQENMEMKIDLKTRKKQQFKETKDQINKIFENLSDIISFQTSHYKSVIKSAHDQILKLKAIIKDLQSRNLSTKRSMDDGGQETAFRFKKSKDKFSYFKTLIRN
jgi:DNA repair exonuclease SbcCD ATPase subunit